MYPRQGVTSVFGHDENLIMAMDGLAGEVDSMSPARLHSNSCEDEVITYLDHIAGVCVLVRA